MRRTVQLTLVILSLLLAAGVVAAAPPTQEEGEGQVYIVKPGDGLIDLAVEFYGDGDAFVLIVKATNAMAATDSSFREIDDPNIILVGEKLWIPGAADIPVGETAETEAEAGSADAAGEAEAEADAGSADAAAETEADSGSAESASEAAAEGTGEASDATAAESETPPVKTKKLAGNSWLLTSLNGYTPIDGAPISLDFVDATKAGGTSGCNNYSTTYETEGIRIKFGPTAGTRMACAEPVMEQEQTYLQALADATFYQVNKHRLRLFDENTTLLAQFEPGSSKLEGSSWDVISYNNGNEAVVSVISGTSITAVFGEDDQLTGSAGCNDYFGPYTTDGSEIAVGPLAATRKLCADEDVMAQEAAYLAALETAVTYSITADSMEMRSEDGALVANFKRSQAAEE